MTDHANMALTKKMPNDTASNYDVTRQTETRLQDKQHETAKLFTSSGQDPLIFDPHDNRNLVLHINYQKVSRLKESQEVASKWGLGRSA